MCMKCTAHSDSEFAELPLTFLSWASTPEGLLVFLGVWYMYARGIDVRRFRTPTFQFLA